MIVELPLKRSKSAVVVTQSGSHVESCVSSFVAIAPVSRHSSPGDGCGALGSSARSP